jgi:hypothetical protein
MPFTVRCQVVGVAEADHIPRLGATADAIFARKSSGGPRSRTPYEHLVAVDQRHGGARDVSPSGRRSIRKGSPPRYRLVSGETWARVHA